MLFKVYTCTLYELSKYVAVRLIWDLLIVVIARVGCIVVLKRLILFIDACVFRIGVCLLGQKNRGSTYFEISKPTFI